MPNKTSFKLVLNFASLTSFEKEKAAASNRVTITPAPGIGDDAFYVTTEFGTSLYIKKGSTAISFGIHEKLPTADIMAKEKTLGLIAVARI